MLRLNQKCQNREDSLTLTGSGQFHSSFEILNQSENALNLALHYTLTLDLIYTEQYRTKG